MKKITHIAHYWFVFQFAVITYADSSKRLAVLFWHGRRHRYYLLVPPLRNESAVRNAIAATKNQSLLAAATVIRAAME